MIVSTIDKVSNPVNIQENILPRIDDQYKSHKQTDEE